AANAGSQPDGSCDDVDARACRTLGGVDMGAGTSCLSTPCGLITISACCLPAPAGCADLDVSVCAAQGGYPQGLGTTCATRDICDTQACCLADDSCLDVTLGECAS